MAGAKFQFIRKCELCGESFMAKTIDSRYCSPRCSKVASQRRKAELLKQQKLDELVKAIPEGRNYITVSEAYAMFGISKDTIYRLIRKGVISNKNFGKKQTRVNKEELLKMYPLRETPIDGKPKHVPKLYSLEPEDCYTMAR